MDPREDGGAGRPLRRGHDDDDAAVLDACDTSRAFGRERSLSRRWSRGAEGAIRAIDPDVPLFRTMAIGQAMDDSTVTSRQADALLKTIAAISALLALAGLYAITAHAVSHQVRELGVRAALGAGPRRLGWFVVRRPTWHIVLGLGAGAGLTLRRCGSSRTALCSASRFSIRGRSG